MPTYEYACSECGTHVEVYQRFSEESLTECGVCGGPLRKVFHPAGILFKGSGFYATDSRSSRSAGGDGSESKADKADSKKAPSKDKGDSKRAPDKGDSKKPSGEAKSDSKDTKKERSA